MKMDWLQCCLCDEVMEDFMISHNPQPLSDNPADRCCAKCNMDKVIPARLAPDNNIQRTQSHE